MRRALALLSPFVALLVWASMAQAITFDYCEYSLTGHGSLAPDNDVGNMAAYLERSRGIDIVSYHVYDRRFVQSWDLRIKYFFLRANGMAYTVWFRCWRENSGSGAYRDSEWDSV